MMLIYLGLYVTNLANGFADESGLARGDIPAVFMYYSSLCSLHRSKNH